MTKIYLDYYLFILGILNKSLMVSGKGEKLTLL